MHILVVNDDGPPSPHSSPYVHSLVRELQAAGHLVSVVLPHTQRSWIGKAHQIGQTVKPSYYRPPPASSPPAGISEDHPARIPDGKQPSELNSEDRSHGSVHRWATSDPSVEEWVLVDGTPASCVQIGLYHFFKDRPPIDLVVSGPNYGRNTTAVYALSSGTLGAALEAAVCRRRAIALSYAFLSRNHDPAIIAATTKHSVRIIEALVRQWPEDRSVDLYSVNVPLVPEVEKHKILWTEILQNYWGDSSCFEEVDGSAGDENEEEERLREEGEARDGNAASSSASQPMRRKHKQFKWAPKFSDVYRSVEDAPPGNDGWAVKEGLTSVTALKANFAVVKPTRHEKELILDIRKDERTADMPTSPIIQPATLELSPKADCVFAIVDYDDAYVQPLIEAALKTDFPPGYLTMIPQRPTLRAGSDDTPSISLAALGLQPDAKILQIAAYEAIDFDYALAHPQTCLINSYVIRKALIRKHFLTATVENWVAKNPSSILADHVKRSEAFEVDYAEFLDDALIEAFDLRASLERNAAVDGHAPAQPSGSEEALTSQAGSGVGQQLGDEDTSNKTGRPPTTAQQQKEWWILKPSMSDRGQGIRLFSTMAELQSIFDEWDAKLSDDGEEEDGDEDEEDEVAEYKAEDHAKSSEAILGSKRVPADEKEYIAISHLRHFIAQPYIHPPLLVPGDSRKFHIRTYVLAIGSLQVYVFREMLALFAAEPYAAPEDSANANANLDAHLTNTCLQTEDATKAISVHKFWDLSLSTDQKTSVFDQICQVTGEIFEAAARGMTVHFQPLPNAFEVFGVDFLVDARGTAWLLEINAFPDFRQTGDELRGIVAEFWKEALRLAVGPFVRLETNTVDADGIANPATSTRASGDDNAKDRMVLVCEVNLGQRRRAT